MFPGLKYSKEGDKWFDDMTKNMVESINTQAKKPVTPPVSDTDQA